MFLAFSWRRYDLRPALPSGPKALWGDSLLKTFYRAERCRSLKNQSLPTLCEMNIEQLKEEQLAAARKVITSDDFGDIKTIGGCDCAYVNNTVIAAIAVCDDKLRLIEKQTAAVENDFPYLSGLLYYREGRAMEEAIAK